MSSKEWFRRHVSARFEGIERETLEYWLFSILDRVPQRLEGFAHGLVLEAKDDARTSFFPPDPPRMTHARDRIVEAVCQVRSSLETRKLDAAQNAVRVAREAVGE